MKHKFKLLFLLSTLFSFLQLSSVQGQIISNSESRSHADSLIETMHSGVLIVPLFKNSNKIEKLKALINDPELNKNTKHKLEQSLQDELIHMNAFNEALRKYFIRSFDFCEVYFIDNDLLGNFKPDSKYFKDPESGLIDTSINLGKKPYFFLKYFKASGIAAHPREVRSFKIADHSFNTLNHPFPESPDRRTSFKLRFRDLLNLRLNTNELINTLVIKLNENLNRYFIR